MYDTFTIDGRTYEQELKNSKGEPPYLPPETIVYLQSEKKYGTIKHQKLHYDVGETFFGNVIVHLDNDTYISTNGWMCLRVQDDCFISLLDEKQDKHCSLGTLGCTKDHNLELF